MNKFLEKRRKPILITLGVLLVFTLLFGATYAFFANFISDTTSTDINASSDANHKLIFNEGTSINLVSTMQNFTEGGGNLSGESVASATLTSNTSGDLVQEEYNVYYLVRYNEYTYTTPDKTPEMIITITDPEGVEVTEITGLSHVTVNGVSGFDITEYQGIIPVAEDYSIETNNNVDGLKQEWTVKIYYINLDAVQNNNSNKTLESDFLLSKDTHTTIP